MSDFGLCDRCAMRKADVCYECYEEKRFSQADLDAAVAAERGKCLKDIDASEGDLDYAKFLIRARGKGAK